MKNGPIVTDPLNTIRPVGKSEKKMTAKPTKDPIVQRLEKATARLDAAKKTVFALLVLVLTTLVAVEIIRGHFVLAP